MARIYANENFPRRVVVALRDLGHEVLTTQEAGQANQGISDEDVLAFAANQGRAVITLNRSDFIRLHIIRPEHRGIIVCTQDADMDGQAQRIHAAIAGLSSLDGQLIRINRPVS